MVRIFWIWDPLWKADTLCLCLGMPRLPQISPETLWSTIFCTTPYIGGPKEVYFIFSQRFLLVITGKCTNVMPKNLSNFEQILTTFHSEKISKFRYSPLSQALKSARFSFCQNFMNEKCSDFAQNHRLLHQEYVQKSIKFWANSGNFSFRKNFKVQIQPF